jgi:(2Fe-2S) ferredoxin
MAKPEKHVFVCTHTRPSDDPKGCCTARGGQAVVDAFVGAFEARGLWGRFKLNTSSCFGTCERGPCVLVYPEGVLYQPVKPDDVAAIVEGHLLAGAPVEALRAAEEVWG